jgi:hypothetical protein
LRLATAAHAAEVGFGKSLRTTGQEVIFSVVLAAG